LAACLLVTGAGAASATECRPPLEPWAQIELYLGRDIAGVGEVTERQFRHFLGDAVTPRFPDGLTVADVDGQFRDGRRIVRERSKLLILLVPEAEVARPKVAELVAAYKKRFRQRSVLRTETPLCLAFD
jgi:Protein of unknown function (DUF3574)